MKRPSFQFYPADWRNNAKLRRCSWEARGAWLEVMCLLHDSEEYGLLRWTLKEIAQAIGAPIKLLNELAAKGVLKGGDKGHDALIYTPRSGRKDGEPVTLIGAGKSSMWFSSRMVIDEHVRQKKGNHDLFNSSPNRSPKPPIGEHMGESPNKTPKPPESDLPTSTSTSTSKNIKSFDDSFFDEAWNLYPKRPGASKAASLKAWKARIKAGVDPSVMVEGVKRYANFCKAMETDAQFIKQPATFFGPDEHYLADWTPSESTPKTKELPLGTDAQIEHAYRVECGGDPKQSRFASYPDMRKFILDWREKRKAKT